MTSQIPTPVQPPLSGLRVLSIEQYGAGPFATMILGDLGAEIIKIEDEEGDVARYVPPYLGTVDSIYFQSLNRNKKSVVLDLRSMNGRRAFDELVLVSDAVFNNLRGDQPAERGLDYAALGKINRRVVCAHLSGFGRVGERATLPGYDYLMQGYAGWMGLTGSPDGPPTKTGLSLVDLSAGVFASLGLVSAVRRAELTGHGGDVDVSLYDTALSLLTYVGAWHLTRGYVPARLPDSSHPSQVPSQLLPTSDAYLVVMCAKEKFFQRLVTLMGRPELADDERFRDFEARLRNRDALIPQLKALSVTKTTAEWLAILNGQVPCAPVNTVEQALSDPLVSSRLFISTPHETFGEVRQLAIPIAIENGVVHHIRGPRLGEHTAQVLTELTSVDPQDLGRGRR